DPEGNPVRLWQPDEPVAPESTSPTESAYVRPLDDDTRPGSSPRWRRWLPWLPIALGAILAVVVTTVLQREGPPEATDRSPTPTAAATTPTTPAGSDPVSVERLEPRMLGVEAGWELFARSADELVRIELAEGRITRTDLGTSSYSESAYFVVGPRGALIRPADDVAGEYVADGEAPREVFAPADRSGPAHPGPEPGTVWVPEHRHGQDSLALMTLDGEPRDTRVPVPSGFWPSGPDGAGYVLGHHTGGTYTVRPDGLHRVTTGMVLAAGPTRFLTVECDERARCSRVVVDRDSGTRRVLPGGAGGAMVGPGGGTISPDGSLAAIPSDPMTGRLGYNLLDLSSGEEHPVTAVTELDHARTPAFSPDGRWLFVPGSADGLIAFDTRTKQTRQLPVDLRSVADVAVRPAE
ncbi:hypothetical protein, partial [Qaidamihabitans albus]|uniref:hypothetical protein n=1 Tax=Qaidamihabitans albus TaxID=2795733 RepID=UPI0018F1199D